MSRIRKRQAGMVGIVVAVSAVLVLAISGTFASAAKVLKRPATFEARVNGASQASANDNYTIHRVTATCPGNRKVVSGNAYWTAQNNNVGGLRGRELIVTGVQRVGNGFTAEGVSDLNNNAVNHQLVVQVQCSKRATI
jgi:hypothetical protein